MALWTPAEIDTELWLDAADATTITIDTGVSEWLDKSSTLRHFVQTTTTKQPEYIADILNGNSGFRFDGTKELQSTVIMPKDAISYFIAYKSNTLPSSSSFQSVLCLRADSSNRTEFGLFNLSGYTPYQFINDLGGATAAVGIADTLTTNPVLLSWTYNNGANNSTGSYTSTLNGTAVSIAASSSTGITDAALSKIGNRIAQSFPAIIDLYEIIAVSGVVLAAARQIIEGYLAWKWGLEASLPVGHPYKDAAPVISSELLDFTSTGGIILGGTSITSYFVGPVGKFLLSTTAIPGLFQGSRALFVSPTRDYEDGGIALNDSSQGLQYQRWRCRIFGDYVVLDAESVLPQVIFVGAELTECSIAFDRNMRPALAVVEAGQAKLQWFDTSVGEQVITFLDPDVVTPRVTLDDKRNAQSDVSDIILAYVRLGGLYYRQQRDRFLIEYLLDAGPHTGINKIGMNKHFRLQFSMMGVAP